MADVLALQDVTKTFGGLTALDDVSFEIEENSVTGLIGPNGAGKTTLFDVLTGILRPTSGTIRFKGEPIQDLSTPEVAARGIGRTFQTPKEFAGMTVEENLRFVPPNQTGESVLGAVFRPTRTGEQEQRIGEQASEILEFLELDDLAGEYARSLSGGQRKLLELGQVLMLDPDVLMLDEPFAGVNPALTDHLLDRIHDINDQGRTVVLIEHDTDLIMENCEDVVVLDQGRVLTTGTPAEVRQDDRVIEAYLGI